MTGSTIVSKWLRRLVLCACWAGLWFAYGRMSVAEERAAAKEEADVKSRFVNLWMREDRDHLAFHYVSPSSSLELEGCENLAQYPDALRASGVVPEGYELESLFKMEDGHVFVVWQRSPARGPGREVEADTGSE